MVGAVVSTSNALKVPPRLSSSLLSPSNLVIYCWYALLKRDSKLGALVLRRDEL